MFLSNAEPDSTCSLTTNACVGGMSLSWFNAFDIPCSPPVAGAILEKLGAAVDGCNLGAEPPPPDEPPPSNFCFLIFDT